MKNKKTGKEIPDSSPHYHEVQSSAALTLRKVLTLHALNEGVELDAADKLLVASEFTALIGVDVMREHVHISKQEALDMFIEGVEEYFSIINEDKIKGKDSDGRG